MSSPMTDTAKPATNPVLPHGERALLGDPVQEPPTPNFHEVPVKTSSPPVRRSNREKIPRKIYDASTGTYVSSS